MCHTDIFILFYFKNNTEEEEEEEEEKKEISKTIGPWAKPNILKDRHAP